MTSSDKVAAPAAKPASFLGNLIGGTFAGIGICLVGHPFDTIKVLLQTQSHTNPVYSGMVDATKKTIKAEGLSGLYKGVASPLAGQMLFNAIQFASYASVKDVTTEGGKKQTGLAFAAAGGVTGFFVTLVEGPQDLIKSQMQQTMLKAQATGAKPEYSSTWDCVKTIQAKRGLLGFFQGYQATLARNVLAVSLYFGVYEVAKLRASEYRGGAPKATDLLAAGAAGGIAYWLFTYPLDVIKSAIQTDAILPADRKYKGYVDTVSKLWAEGGVTRFTRGIAPCLLRAGPANAVGFFLMEITKGLF